MLKLLAIVFLFVLFLRSIGFVLRLLFGSGLAGKTSKEFREGQGRRKRPSKGNVDIDYVPNKKDKKGKGFDGGDYVDYEDVS